MSLAMIVQALGGDLYDGGRRASVPAPGHSPHDRSVSLLLHEGRLIVHSFGAATWQEVLDHLRAQGLLDGHGRPAQPEGPPVARPPLSRPERLAAATTLWATSRPVAGTLSARHLQLRCVGRPPGRALRHHGAVHIGVYRSAGPQMPALLAAITDVEGKLAGVEVTYLGPDGRRHGRLRLARKVVGFAPRGGGVRLDPAGRVLLVGEGVFTTLSASEHFGLPAWALLSAGNLAAWSPPPDVDEVVIAADRDPTGVEAARRLAARLIHLGIRRRIELPPAGHLDWNDAATALAVEVEAAAP